jgi:RNA polymerase sigma factor (sigma-70 family)
MSSVPVPGDSTSGGSGGETCWSLVRRAAEGDREARSRFSRVYLPLVRSFLLARWRRSPLLGELEDSVQEAFVECFRPQGGLARVDAAHGDFRGYLFGIVRNVALRCEERLRKRAECSAATSVPVEIEGHDDTLSKVFDREWARMLMREAGNLMRARAAMAGPAAQRQVELLQLRTQANLPIRTIAVQWRTDVDALHRAYAKAREEFRSCLRQVVAQHVVRTEAELDDECRRLFALLE